MGRERLAEWNAEKVQDGFAIGFCEGLCRGFQQTFQQEISKTICQGRRVGISQTLVAVARHRHSQAVASAVSARIPGSTDERALARLRRLVISSEPGENLLLRMKEV